jgi:hypothetical protein
MDKTVICGDTAFERGQMHGELFKERIHNMVPIWREHTCKAFVSNDAVSAVDFDAFIAAFLRATEYTAAMKQHTPALLEEIRGMAVGAQVKYEEVLAMQLMDEMWAHGKDVAKEIRAAETETAGKADGLGCTTVALRRFSGSNELASGSIFNTEHCVCTAQNMDLEAWRASFQAIVQMPVAPSDSTEGCSGTNGPLEVLLLSQVGMTGMCGINSRLIK